MVESNSFKAERLRLPGLRGQRLADSTFKLGLDHGGLKSTLKNIIQRMEKVTEPLKPSNNTATSEWTRDKLSPRSLSFTSTSEERNTHLSLKSKERWVFFKYEAFRVCSVESRHSYLVWVLALWRNKLLLMCVYANRIKKEQWKKKDPKNNKK